MAWIDGEPCEKSQGTITKKLPSAGVLRAVVVVIEIHVFLVLIIAHSQFATIHSCNLGYEVYAGGKPSCLYITNGDFVDVNLRCNNVGGVVAELTLIA